MDCDEESQLSSNEESPLLGCSTVTRRQNSIQSGLHELYALPGMKIRAYRIRKDGTFKGCTSAEALIGAKGGKRHYWVDIDAGHPESSVEVRRWLLGLNLPNFVIEVLAAASDTWASQVIPLQRACLTVMRILPEDPCSDSLTHVAALTLRNILLTFTSCPTHDTGGLFRQALSMVNEPERLPSPTSSGALMGWLRFHLDRTSRATRDLRYMVLDMDRCMDQDRNCIHIDDIIESKDQLLRYFSVAEEQSECLQALSATAAGSDGLDLSGVSGALGSLVATAKGTERMALRLEKHIADLRQRSQDLGHDTMNRRLACLTAVSVIFLPLTLLTGIW
jgi:CorA-like Mg2+ transporter protein